MTGNTYKMKEEPHLLDADEVLFVSHMKKGRGRDGAQTFGGYRLLLDSR